LVLFLTDGHDGSPDRAIQVSEELKATLLNKNIYSKFSVIGIGDHNSELLGKMCSIGT
jgi:hypothetical protein